MSVRVHVAAQLAVAGVRMSAAPPTVCPHRYVERGSRYNLRCEHCDQQSLDGESGDLRMLEVWAAWARANDNVGAARLFDRIRLRLAKVSA